MILMLTKYQSLKKNNMVNIIHLNNDNDIIYQIIIFIISQTTGYINKFEKNKITMSLMVKDKQLLENYKKNMEKN